MLILQGKGAEKDNLRPVLEIQLSSSYRMRIP